MKSKKLRPRILRLLYKAKWVNLPILTKLLLTFGIIFALMALLSLVNFNNYSRDKEISTLDMVSQVNTQTMDKIDDYIKDLLLISKYPLKRQAEVEQDKHIEIINYVSELIKFDSTNTKSYYFQQLTNQMATEMFALRNQIHSVFVFNTKGLSDYKIQDYAMSSNPFNPVNEKWFKQALEDFGIPRTVSTFEIPDIADNGERKTYVFSVVRGIVSVDFGKVVGVIMVNTKVDFLDNLCKKMLITPGQRIIIADKENNVIYDTNQSNIMKKLDVELSLIIGGKSSFPKYRSDGENALVSCTTSDLTGWKIINLIPVNALNKEIIKMKNITAIVTVSIILISILLAFAISRQIAIPIKKLVLLMNLIKKGDFDVNIKFASRDEIGILAKSFNTMTRKVKRLIKVVYYDKMKQKDLEMQMLQNQINPHFLYNTLESISMMAMINNDEQSSEMASALGKILRYGISKNKRSVTLREELDHLKDYIMLQKARFQKMFEIAVNVDETILDYYTIKLILQPIVENSINHGLSNTRSGGLIEVKGYKQDSNLILEVSDNGIGMTPEQVEKLNDYINDLNNHFKSIGLKNVNRRIKLHYGDEYGIIISSKEEQGTIVKLILPCIEEQNLI